MYLKLHSQTIMHITMQFPACDRNDAPLGRKLLILCQKNLFMLSKRDRPFDKWRGRRRYRALCLCFCPHYHIFGLAWTWLNIRTRICYVRCRAARVDAPGIGNRAVRQMHPRRICQFAAKTRERAREGIVRLFCDGKRGGEKARGRKGQKIRENNFVLKYSPFRDII